MDLHVRQLAKRYAGVTALDGIDLEVRSGELVALLGPSGSGKTTLLRVIAGLLQADRGQVLFGETDATRLSLRDRNVGFVFQHYALFRHMTVFENIAFGLRSRPRRRRPDQATISRKVEELLQLIQLPDFGSRFPDQLSGGQKQRVALARALAIDPSVLLLDEPFGALDAKVRIELRRWLRRLHEQTGQTTVFVTHDQEEALELADRVVVMREGRIEQIGAPDQVYHAPTSAFVFDFIGRASTIDGYVEHGEFVAPGLRTDALGVADGAARLYARPQDIAPSGDGIGVAACLRHVRRLAGRITFELAVDGQPHAVELDILDVPGASVPPLDGRLRLRPLRYRVFPR